MILGRLMRESPFGINPESADQSPPQARETKLPPDNRQSADASPASERFEVDMPHHYRPFNQLRVSETTPHHWTDHPANLRFAMGLYEERENGSDNVYQHLSDELDLYYGADWKNDVLRGKWMRIVWPRAYERNRREIAASCPALVEAFLASKKSMADFLLRRGEYLQNCQQALEADFAEAKTNVAASLARFMADSGGEGAYEDWLAKIGRRLDSTTIWLHDPLSPLVGKDVNDWLDSGLMAVFERFDRRIGFLFRPFLLYSENIIMDIVSHEVLHAAVVSARRVARSAPAEATEAEQSRCLKIADSRSGLRLIDHSAGSDHGFWLNEGLIESFGVRCLNFAEPSYPYEVIALWTLDCLQPGLEDALLRAAVEGSNFGQVFGTLENWLGPLGIELFQEKLRQLNQHPAGYMTPCGRTSGPEKHILEQSQLLGGYFLDLLAPNVSESERVAAGRIWQAKTDEVLLFYQRNQQKEFETDVPRHIARTSSA